MRSKFKQLRKNILDKTVIPWYTGDDVPISWKKKEIRKLKKKTVRKNYKLGSISKKTYKDILKMLRGE